MVGPFRFESVKWGGFDFPRGLFCMLRKGLGYWVRVAGSGPTCGMLSTMCECVNARRVMRLSSSYRVIPHLWGRARLDCPKVCAINHLENHSVRTAGTRPFFAEIRGRKEGAGNSQRLVRDLREIMGKSWTIHRQTGRPSFRALLSAKDASILAHFCRSDIAAAMGPGRGRPRLVADWPRSPRDLP